jgi:hypothetical protein
MKSTKTWLTSIDKFNNILPFHNSYSSHRLATPFCRRGHCSHFPKAGVAAPAAPKEQPHVHDAVPTRSATVSQISHVPNVCSKQYSAVGGEWCVNMHVFTHSITNQPLFRNTFLRIFLQHKKTFTKA